MAQSHVFDTYARTREGRIMHFDVILDDKDAGKALRSAREWLASIGEDDASVSQENCCFCHSTEAPEDMRKEIGARGYAIYKLEGCPA